MHEIDQNYQFKDIYNITFLFQINHIFHKNISTFNIDNKTCILSPKLAYYTVKK